MGCDIHLHIEVKLTDHEGWQHYGMPRVPRNYFLFANMAGVRNIDDEVAPIAQPRGIPSDANVLTAFDYERWAGDAHTASWLSSEEIGELRQRMLAEFPAWHESEALGGLIFGNYPSDFVNEKPAGTDDMRFVFWFDN